MNYSEIYCCRACKSKDLETITNLGNMHLSGQFPRKGQKISSGPLELVRCNNPKCNLVQLKQTFNLKEMYGDNYGYRSSLNQSMINHLKSKVEDIKALDILEEKDIILDIGSNDGTTLSQYEENKFQLIGIDPSAEKFRKYYRKDINLVVNFFSAKYFKEVFGNNSKAKVVTSFAMFYDLEDPVSFAKDVEEILDINGVWIIELSYLPTMLSQNSYDTICHEHLEYYGLKQIKFIVEKVGMEVIDYTLNDVNGGSISVFVGNKKSNITKNIKKIENTIINEEKVLNKSYFSQFEKKINQLKTDLLIRLKTLKNQNKSIYCLGASTKGNIILQYCNIDSEIIDAIGEVNEDKFGCYTPGSNIPIVSEKEALEKGDVFLILPWHFSKTFLKKEIFKGKHLIFPLPEITEFNY